MQDQFERIGVALSGRYRIERELGAGGMASVYLAYDVKHDRDVAIKVLHPELGATLGGDRFLSEIRTTARLQHPHILPLLDSGEADGLLFYVMPVVDDETLRARLDRERQLPLEDAIRIATETASALAYAHRHGVIHRDIKPENILLHDGRAVVADFGIALAVSTAGGPRMTQTGVSLGTPQYMAPEQAMGERQLDGRVDVYALGAVTYELLTGEPPFSGATVQAIVARVLTERPPNPRAVRDTIPHHVEATILKALAKLPADRFATAAQFADALAHSEITSRAGNAEAASSGSLPRRAPTRMARLWDTSPVVWLALAITAVVAAGGWLRGEKRTPVSELAVPLAEVTGAAPAVGPNGVALALAPDGTTLAFSGADSTGLSKVFVRSLADADARAVVATERVAFWPAFSPDGKVIAYWVPIEQAIRIHSLTNRSVQTIATSLPVRGLTWIDNGTIVYSNNRTLWRRALNASEPESLVEGLASSTEYVAPFAASTDVVLFEIRTVLDGGHELAALSLRDKRVLRLGIRGSQPGFVDGGILTYLSEGSLWGVPFNPETMKLKGQPRMIVQGDVAGFNYAVARGAIIVTARWAGAVARELVEVSRTGAARPLLAERRAFRWPRFSPDGRRIAVAVAVTDGPSPIGDLWLATARGNAPNEFGTLTRLTSDSSSTRAEWDPDGRSLIFIRGERGAPTRLDRMAADGSDTASGLVRRPNSMFESAMTPDRRTIIWREDARGTTRDIFMAPLDSPTAARPIRNSRFDERSFALSPDGRWLAYTSNETGSAEVYICRLEPNGARWRVSPGGGREPRWARTNELFYRNGDSLFVTPVTLGAEPTIRARTLLFVSKGYVTSPFEPTWDVSPDGQRFVMVRDSPDAGATLTVLVNWVDRWRASQSQAGGN